MNREVQTCMFLNRGLMGFFACSEDVEKDELRKLDWHWLETRSSAADVQAGPVMAWMQPLRNDLRFVARLVRSAPSGLVARWSIRAIVVNTDTYEWLLDRLVNCIGDEEFWTDASFSNGIPIRLPEWMKSADASGTDRAQITNALSQVKNEGLARIDRTSDCEPWALAVQIPSMLRGDARVRLRWLVGFDHFPRGTHVVAGRFASRAPHDLPSAPSPRISTSTNNPSRASLDTEQAKSKGEDDVLWHARLEEPSRFRLVIPAICVLVIIGAVVLAIVRVHAGRVA